MRLNNEEQLKSWADLEGRGVLIHQKNHKYIGFPSNIDLDPLKITKLPSQHSMVSHHPHISETPFQSMAFPWQAIDGPL